MRFVCLRWRGGPSRQSSQRQQNNANRERASGGQGDGRGGNNTWAASGPTQEQHVPVRGFNASEAKNILRKGKLGQSYTQRLIIILTVAGFYRYRSRW